VRRQRRRDLNLFAPHDRAVSTFANSPVITARLSDQQLTAQVIQLARHEREATASLVAHLAEFGARKLYLGQGCATLFTSGVWRRTCVSVFDENTAGNPFASAFGELVGYVVIGGVFIPPVLLVGLDCGRRDTPALFSDHGLVADRCRFSDAKDPPRQRFSDAFLPVAIPAVGSEGVNGERAHIVVSGGRGTCIHR